jgi:hypothetical protein
MSDQRYLHATAILGGTNDQYRYWLERQWLPEPPVPGLPRTVGFIGYNPSTADATQDDQTIRKEVGFAQRWGFNRLITGNLYAYRSTIPTSIRGLEDPVGPDNPTYLTRIFEQAELVVCAWGGLPLFSDYGKTLATWAQGQPTARCLGKNRDGSPRHPCYLSYATALEKM